MANETIKPYEDKDAEILQQLTGGVHIHPCRTCKSACTRSRSSVDYYGAPTAIQQVGKRICSGSTYDP